MLKIILIQFIKYLKLLLNIISSFISINLKDKSYNSILVIIDKITKIVYYK